MQNFDETNGLEIVPIEDTTSSYRLYTLSYLFILSKFLPFIIDHDFSFYKSSFNSEMLNKKTG